MPSHRTLRALRAFGWALLFMYLSGAFINFDFLWLMDIGSWHNYQRVQVWYCLFIIPVGVGIGTYAIMNDDD